MTLGSWQRFLFLSAVRDYTHITLTLQTLYRLALWQTLTSRNQQLSQSFRSTKWFDTVKSGKAIDVLKIYTTDNKITSWSGFSHLYSFVNDLLGEALHVLYPSKKLRIFETNHSDTQCDITMITLTCNWRKPRTCCRLMRLTHSRVAFGWDGSVNLSLHTPPLHVYGRHEFTSDNTLCHR